MNKNILYRSKFLIIAEKRISCKTTSRCEADNEENMIIMGGNKKSYTDKGVKDDWDFWVFDLVKTPDGTDI